MTFYLILFLILAISYLDIILILYYTSRAIDANYFGSGYLLITQQLLTSY